MFDEIMRVAQRIRQSHAGIMSGGQRVGRHSIEALGLPAWDRTQRLVAQLRNFGDAEFHSRHAVRRVVGVARAKTAVCWPGTPVAG